MNFVGALTGLPIAPARFGIIKKRYVAIEFGGSILVHPKTYKKICRCKSPSKKFTRLISKLKVKCSIPVALDFTKPSFFDCDRLLNNKHFVSWYFP